MNFLRPVLVVALILASILVSGHYSPHHVAENPFIQLFGHLVPVPLVVGAHDAGAGAQHCLLSFDVSFLSDKRLDSDAFRDGVQIAFTNLQIFQICAVLLLVVCFSGVPAYLATGRGDYLTKLFAGAALWFRDDMVYPLMGKKTGRKFLPYLLTLFFFVLFMNLLGLVPGAATATASVFVTAALALLTLLVMVFGGMIAQGPVAYWKNLVPHVPVLVLPIMIVVEVVGLFVKPFALMIRLFANMTGGHMVVLSFMGLIFMVASLAGDTAAWATSPLLVGFAVFIMIIESFVALLQAYIFTILSIMFIQSSLHPEH